MELKEILEQAGTSDSHFRELYDSTIDRVFSFVLFRVRDRDVAREICQESYISLWRFMPKFKYISDAHFYAFLFKVVRFCIGKARTKKKEVSLEEIFDVPADSEEKEDYRTLHKGLGKLKDKQRIVLELRYFKDLDFASIAQMLGISESNAKVLHHRAIKKLKELLPQYE